MLVFIQNKHGEALMPCKPQKARKLLKDEKAEIVSYTPFTIKLLYGSSGYKQPIKVGIDLGTKHTGIAITTDDKVLVKGEVEVRQDVKSLLETRRIYRRSRRNRKRKEVWLPPSIQSRLDNTFHWIDKFLRLVPNPVLTIEVGKFDIQKMMNPEIEGEEYQQGQTLGYHNVRYFVFARDNYTCQVCKKKGGILNTHHLVYRSHGGSNRSDNLITVCTDCHTHENHQKDAILWKWMVEGKKPLTYKEGTFMNIFRKRVFTNYPQSIITYGSVTTPRRKELGLEKTHAHDAIAISGITRIKQISDSVFYIKQFRKKKRSLHEATARKGRKTKNVTSKRNVKNVKELKRFYLNDKVRVYRQVGYITGFTGTSMAYVKDIYGNYITKPHKSYKQVNLKDCEFLHHNNNWQYVANL